MGVDLVRVDLEGRYRKDSSRVSSMYYYYGCRQGVSKVPS